PIFAPSIHAPRPHRSQNQRRVYPPRSAVAIHRGGAGCGALLRGLDGPWIDYIINDTVLFRVGRREISVALGVVLDFVDVLASVRGHDLVEPAAQREDLARVDLDVGSLAAEAAERLVDHHAAVGQS